MLSNMLTALLALLGSPLVIVLLAVGATLLLATAAHEHRRRRELPAAMRRHPSATGRLPHQRRP